VTASPVKSEQLRYSRQCFDLWDSFGLSKCTLGLVKNREDARGRWYANICIKVSPLLSQGVASVGIDLGLKDFATVSDGTKIETKGIYQGANQNLMSSIVPKITSSGAARTDH